MPTVLKKRRSSRGKRRKRRKIEDADIVEQDEVSKQEEQAMDDEGSDEVGKERSKENGQNEDEENTDGNVDGDNTDGNVDGENKGNESGGNKDGNEENKGNDSKLNESEASNNDMEANDETTSNGNRKDGLSIFDFEPPSVMTRRQLKLYEKDPKKWNEKQWKLRKSLQDQEEAFTQVENLNLQDPTLIYRYGNLNLTQGDLNRLEPLQYLNDILIDYGIEKIKETLASEVSNDFHFFSTQFYPLLSRDESSCLRCAQRIPSLSTKIFEKKMLFIPINKKNHWTLCVVVPHGVNCYKNEQSERPVFTDQRVILCADSLHGRDHNYVFSMIRKYLSYRFDLESSNESEEPTNFLAADFKGRYITFPLQDNDCDCGLFLLRYMEEFIKMSPISDLYSDKEVLFPISEVTEKRGTFKSELIQLSKTFQSEEQSEASPNDYHSDSSDCMIIQPSSPSTKSTEG